LIARLWSARTTQTQCHAYVQHFCDAVLPALRKFDGFLSSTVLTRDDRGTIEILVVTVWQSYTAIDAFAGSDREAAVVAPEAVALLTDFDRRVRHFEVAVSDGLTRS
jgi:heme-degrading monooxygenase HmoA